jgi:coatomer subunit beta
LILEFLVLIEFLADKNELAALDVLVFIRDVMQKFSNLKDLIVQRLLDICSQIKSVKVLRATLWLLGEYCASAEDIQNVMTFIRQSLGDLPIVDDEIRRSAGETKDEQDTSMSAPVQRLVTADGTYATQSAFISTNPTDKKTLNGVTNDRNRQPSLRTFLLDGDFFIGAALATSLCKLVIRYIDFEGDSTKQNRFCAEAMFIIASILHLGRTNLPSKPMNEDDHDRMLMCIRLLNERLPITFQIFGEECRIALADMLTIKVQEQKEMEKKLSKGKTATIEPDDPIRFTQLLAANEFDEKEDILDLTLRQAIGTIGKKDEDIFSSSKLSKVTQLTGFSDPVYAEAYVNVNQYDIVLDVLIGRSCRLDGFFFPGTLRMISGKVPTECSHKQKNVYNNFHCLF